MPQQKIIEFYRGAGWPWLVRLEKILSRKFKFKGQISLVLVTPERMRELNRLYRRQDKITDVLSFYLSGPEVLGEVIICRHKAREQARRYGHSLTAELKLLTVHGILHLLGFDHERSANAAREQERVEKEILASLG